MLFRPRVVLVGRTNVGKSTLFNKLIGKRESIVHDSYGVTRDPVHANCLWNGKEIDLIDSGGLDFESRNVMSSKITFSANEEIKNAHVLVLVTSIDDGVLPIEKKIVIELRKNSKPIILCVNKCDNNEKKINFYEFYSLGIKDQIAVSSIHGHGTGDLLDRIFNICESYNYFESYDSLVENEKVINISVIGRPNVGKSSFVNKICSKQKFIVSEIAGTTRDSTSISLVKKDKESNTTKNYIFVDTAGIRRKSKIVSSVEFYGFLRTERAIKNSDVCIFIMDPVEGITRQDLKIAGLTKKHGKACIILVNKWDLIENKDEEVYKFQKKIEKDFAFMNYSEFIFVSVKTGQRIDKIFNIIDSTFENFSLRISTSNLNNLLSQIITRVTTPKINNQKLKIYYVTQVCSKPPTFVFFVNKERLFHFSYQRYIENCFRQVFNFSNTPVKILIREKNTQENLENDTKVNSSN